MIHHDKDEDQTNSLDKYNHGYLRRPSVKQPQTGHSSTLAKACACSEQEITRSCAAN